MNGEVRTEVVDNINNVMKLRNDFNPEVKDSLRPNRSSSCLNKTYMGWP